MPFTPFHMGFALVAKAAVSRYFSIPVFAFTQVIIDAEVLIGLALVGDLSNHAVLHNFAAAVLVTLLAVLLRRPVIQPGARLWNHIARARTGSFLHMATRVSMTATIASALFGGVSHVLLDATTHSDMAPFAPLNHHNPFFGLLSPLQTILISLLLFAVGGGVILALSYRRHSRCKRTSIRTE